MLARFGYYTSLAIRDLVRLWSSTQHHVLIVAGICLPILLLLGLKRGHVEELRRELMTSPTGRQIVFWATQNGKLIDSTGVDKLQATLPGAELMIPDQQRVVLVTDPAGTHSLTLTLYSTRKGDPILAQYQSDVLEPAEKAIVIPDNVATSLHVTRGDTVEITVRRDVNGQEETAVLSVRVKAIYPSGGDKPEIGYVDTGVLSSLEQYVRGYAVRDFGWRAAPVAIPDTYAQYLYLFEKGASLTRDDEEYLENRGLRIEEINASQPWELSALVKPDVSETLRGYRIYSESSKTDSARRLSLSPSELTEILSIPDDVAIPWNTPLAAVIDGAPATLVGLSLPRRCWLRSKLVNETVAFPFDATSAGVTWPFRAAVAKEIAAIAMSPDQTCDVPQAALAIEPPQATPAPSEAPPPTPIPDIAIVPVDLLARITSLASGLAIYDPQTRLIAPAPASVVFDKIRLFAKTIDNVPELAQQLYADGFAVQSEDDRIREIHEQDSSLRLLVFVVGLGVFLFGVLTVISVLVDSTDRKRGTLGILRVMGVSKLGVFWIVVLRAAVIGFLAGCLSVIFGQLLASFLEWQAPTDSILAAWKPNVRISLTPEDVLFVFLGALVCASLGAVYPAFRASRLDPFDAIVEGRFR